MSLPASFDGFVEAHMDQIVAFRRRLHRQPELGGEETKTAGAIAATLAEAGFTVREHVGGTGVVATLGSGSPCLALRADMDALPIHEDASHTCVSEVPGVMHACGHDFHTAWLTGVGLVAADAGLPRGSLKLVFQPAEETISGAAGMIADGVLENPYVDAVCGAHVSPDMLAGQIALRPGSNLAAADRFVLRVLGAGTHGASPHLGKDPIPMAAEIITTLQTLVSRRLDPVHSGVVSVCQIHAGSAFNIIPSHVDLEGTVRTLLPQDRAMLEEAIGKVAAGVADAHGGTVEFTYTRGVPPTVTDANMTALARQAISEVLGEARVQERELPSMGAEDFALFLERRPGALLWVGCAPAEEATRTMSLHHPLFEADEGCLRPAMKSLLAVAYAYLSRPEGNPTE